MSDAALRKKLRNSAPMIQAMDSGQWPGEVTLETLLSHHKRYGWDRKRQGSGRFRKWVDKTYRTYNQMREDSLMQVGRAYLSGRDYLKLVEALGQHSFVKDAIKREGTGNDE